MTTQIKPVTIPREVAVALDAAREAGVTNSAIIDVRNDEFRSLIPEMTSAVLRLIPFDTLLSALVNGYERELTEEEAREKAYADIRDQHALFNHSTDEWDGGYQNGMEYVLDALGIVIDGVNNEGGAA